MDDKKHVDHIAHKWSSMSDKLIKRLPADCPLAGRTGDYTSYSEPHTMEECPFKDA